ncbi:UbiX family flavin prenyltransferase [Millionella massiliensis]|uniref:UbiX family flavin prenyltransferase n=1 Tax=Millionella massiliensis TaxID=1871023 RepID=UPI0008D9741E|nr:UbiX family flavin prenyltransferase [Millionella massiliensis]
MKIAVGITGASGAIYAERLLWRLVASREAGRIEALAVVFTKNGRDVARFERPEFLSWLEKQVADGRVAEYADDDFFTPLASGSAGYDALAVVPCSMGMAGRIAGGVSDDLIARMADVMLKENSPLHPRQLILCPRETPLSLIHLRNLTALREAGAVVLPAVPSFYTRPTTIEEAVDTVVLRLLSVLGLLPDDFRGWQE